jgi:hypothetical protein
MRGEVTKALRQHPAEILGVNHVDSTYIVPDEILALIPDAAKRTREGVTA